VPDIYKDRSPINHADRIRSPLLVLQGADDEVVPPAQSELIVETIHNNGGTAEYKLYEGEGHGWRKADTIKDALERELAFYRSTFNLNAQG
jgi:dipeptidyl aminopeptidase/acylaminoacyl peptidase